MSGWVFLIDYISDEYMETIGVLVELSELLGSSSSFLIPEAKQQAIGSRLYSMFKKPINAFFYKTTPSDLLVNILQQNISWVISITKSIKGVPDFKEHKEIYSSFVLPKFLNSIQFSENLEEVVFSVATSTGFPSVTRLKVNCKQMILKLKEINPYVTTSCTDLSSYSDFLQTYYSTASSTVGYQLNDQLTFFKGGPTPDNQIPAKRIASYHPNIYGYKNKIRIMPCTNWCDSSFLVKEWSRFFEGSSYELVTTQPDLFLVINQTNIPIDPTKTIYFMMEPYGERLYEQWLSQYKQHLKFYGCHKHHLNNVEWHLQYGNKDIQSKQNKSTIETKIKGLCMIISDKQSDPGQRYRVEMAKRLDYLADTGKLGFPFVVYGQCSSLKLKSYKGELPRICKNQVLEQYQYQLIAENNDISNYITEKLYDGFITNTVTFYWGCSNTEEYFHKDSFIRLSGNIEQDIQHVIYTIHQNAYEKRIPFMKESVSKLLTIWNMSKRLDGILELSETLVVSYYHNKPSDEMVTFNKQQLNDQSFTHTSQGIFNRQDKTLNWLVQLASTSLQQKKPILINSGEKSIPTKLFESISTSLIEQPNVDLILYPSYAAPRINQDELLNQVSNVPFYLRLTGAEIIMNLSQRGISGLGLLSQLKIAGKLLPQ